MASDTKKGRSDRGLHVRVKTAKGRKPSSTRWLERQLNDPFVRRAQAEGYRSRAAFKLEELQEKFGFLKRGALVVDLGAAPGGWCQIARKHVGEAGRIVAVDMLEMEGIAGVAFLQHDFTTDAGNDAVAAALGGRKADAILSDMAAPTCGHQGSDHLRTLALCETAFEFCTRHLARHGSFVAKLFQGGTEKEFLQELQRSFARVKHVKPDASRKESSELYLACLDYKHG
jgi:23S rRNA (uridine2552-2'-O)-methyltransferase